MKKKDKGWKVKFSDEVIKELDNLPDEVYDKLTEIVKGVKEGRLDPTKIGNPVDFIDLDKKLQCPKCDSKKVEWVLDKNSKDVIFNCFKCNECFWMTYSEHKNAIKRNSHKLVRINK